MFDYIATIPTDIQALLLLDSTFARILTRMVAFLLFSRGILLFSWSISAPPLFTFFLLQYRLSSLRSNVNQ
jgi:hypothetical protein